MLWEPSEAFVNNSNLKKFEIWLQKEKKLNFASYAELWTWSTDFHETFWTYLAEYFKVIFHSPYREVLSDDKMPNARWFQGATLNYAEHVFRMSSNERPALIFQNETNRHTLSWSSLEKQVIKFQQYLISQGIKKGDRICAFLPNIPEAMICFLAVNGLGAVWSCCSPDFGVSTVLERFGQIKPKLFIAADGYQYNGKSFSKIKEVEDIRNQLETLTKTVFIQYQDPHAQVTEVEYWSDIMNAPTNQDQIIFEPVDFDHPIWVLYSSGTTGKPKAITHGHGGVLLEHLKYMHFHNDAKEGEHFFWFTTTGWMMWNFLQASFLSGSIPVLYDGSPGSPDLYRLWQLAEELPIQHFGTSAPFLTACMKQRLDIKSKFKLNHLRSIGSTGAPLPPDVFEWIYKEIKEDLWLCSMSGGTDVCTAFVGGVPYLPVYKGLIQGRALGCALFGYDDDKTRVSDQLGEMVIEKPMPSMPIYFWNDPEKQRYNQSYFGKYPGVWRHGDWIKLFSNGSLMIMGRSDATLNRNGIRIGTAEIYNVLDQIEMIKDALVLNLEQADGVDVMPLFVVLNDRVELDETLISLIKTQLRKQCSFRHVPDHITVVDDIPYTLSGKKMEVPVKKIFKGIDISKSLNKDAVRNPKALDQFVELAKRYL